MLITHVLNVAMGFPGGSVGKNAPASTGDGFSPWVGKIPLRKEWPPTPVFLPGRFHGQRGLAGYSPWGRKESDMTEHTHAGMISTNLFILFIFFFLLILFFLIYFFYLFFFKF